MTILGPVSNDALQDTGVGTLAFSSGRSEIKRLHMTGKVKHLWDLEGKTNGDERKEKIFVKIK